MSITIAIQWTDSDSMFYIVSQETGTRSLYGLQVIPVKVSRQILTI